MTEILFARLDETLLRANNLSDLTDITSARNNIGLGSVPNTNFTGKPIFVLFSGQSQLTRFKTLAYTRNPNAKIWNNVIGTVPSTGTAFVALNSTNVNLAEKILSNIADNNPTSLVFGLNVAVSGTAISHWAVGTSAPDMFASIQDNITAALAAANKTAIDVFVWANGEASTGPLDTTYITQHSTMMSRFWADTTTGAQWFPKETKVLIIGIASTADSGNADGDNMNNILQAVAGTHPDARRFVNIGGLSGSTYWDPADIAHGTAQGYFSFSALATNELLFGTGRGTVNKVNVDPTNGRIVLGNHVVSTARIAMNFNADGVIAPVSTANIQYIGANATVLLSDYYSFGSQIQSFQNLALGTLLAPLAVGSAGTIYQLIGRPYDGSTYNSSVRMRFLTTNLQTATDHSGRIIFGVTSTTPSATITDQIWFQSSGGVSIGVDSDQGNGTLNLLAGLYNNGVAPIGTGAYVRAITPTFTGVPAAPTAAVDTNTTQIATTAMVLAQAASATPLGNGTAAVGTSTRFARGDHVHPIDAKTGILQSSITAVNFNSANSDNAIPIVLPPGFTRFTVFRIQIGHASGTLTTSTLGLFSNTAGGGTAIIAGSTANAVSTATDGVSGNEIAISPSIAVEFIAASLPTANTIYFRVGTAQGTAATADVSVLYIPRP